MITENGRKAVVSVSPILRFSSARLIFEAMKNQITDMSQLCQLAFYLTWTNDSSQGLWGLW